MMMMTMMIRFPIKSFASSVYKNSKFIIIIIFLVFGDFKLDSGLVIDVASVFVFVLCVCALCLFCLIVQCANAVWCVCMQARAWCKCTQA